MTPLAKTLDRLAAGLARPIDWAGQLAAACGLFLVFVVAGNVLARYVFNLSSVAAQELEWHLVPPIALLGMSYALQRGDHVRVDVVYDRMSARGRQVVDLVTALLLFAVSVIVVSLSLPYVQQSFGMLEGSPDPGGIPYRWVLKSFIPLGFALLALQSLGQGLSTLAALLSPEGAPLSPTVSPQGE